MFWGDWDGPDKQKGFHTTAVHAAVCYNHNQASRLTSKLLTTTYYHI